MSAQTRLPVSVSVGVAAFREGMNDPLELVEDADSALYAAKQAGRNRVILRYTDGSMR
jgi:diguanylate cyclase (GGDEF)-like protein